MHLSILPLSEEEEGGGVGGYGGGEGFGESGRRGRGRVCMSTGKWREKKGTSGSGGERRGWVTAEGVRGLQACVGRELGY